MGADPVLCPSARCTNGAILLGIVMPDGRVAFAPNRVAIDRTFVETARRGRAPEKRFRFGSPCVESGCQQWTGSRCGVIDAVVDALTPAAGDASLPECSIRPDCRWFAQSGATACAVCSEIVTDQRAEPAPTGPAAP